MKLRTFIFLFGWAASVVMAAVQSQSDVTLKAVDFAAVRVLPNPWRSDRHAGRDVTFDHLPLGSTLQLFTVSGRLVKTLSTSADNVTWNLTNDSGDKVASGVYLYVITPSDFSGEGQTLRGKLVVIK